MAGELDPAACFRGGTGQRKRLLSGGAPQPHCQQGPLPLPSASDTTWQKQSYSRRRRGAPPSADGQQGFFSNLSLHCWAPAHHGQAPLHGLRSIRVSQSGFEQEAKKEERRQRRRLAGSGSPVTAEGSGCLAEGGAHRPQEKCLWLRFKLPQRKDLNCDAKILGHPGEDSQVKAFWSEKGIPDDTVSGCCRQMLLSNSELHVRGP